MSNEPVEHRGKTRRSFRRWGIVSALLAVIACAAVSLYLRQVDPERIRARAEKTLQEYVNGDVSVEAASFSWFEGIRLSNVSIFAADANTNENDPSTSMERFPVFSCGEVILTPDVSSLLVGDLRLESVTAIQPKCLIVRDVKSGRTNLTDLLRLQSIPGDSPGIGIPIIELRSANVQVCKRRGYRFEIADDITLTIRGKLAESQSRYYDIVWHRQDSEMAGGHSQVDLVTGSVRNIEGGLPWMSLEAVMIAVNASFDAAGTWGDLLGLEGTVRARDYNLGAKADQPRSATIDLENATLSIPLSDKEHNLSAEDRYLRFEQVYGSIVATNDAITADFEAMFQGSRCKAVAKLRNKGLQLTSLDDVDFDVELHLEQLLLPTDDPSVNEKQARFVNRWPTLVQFYCDYDPHGRFDIDLKCSKAAGSDAPVTIEKLVVAPRGADASCRYFPYRLKNLTGSLELTPEGVFLRKLGGDHAEGTAYISGWLAAPNRCSPVELSITGRGNPIDKALGDALSLSFKAILDEFQPAGFLDEVEVSLSRPGCKEGRVVPWESSVSVAFSDLTATYERFPVSVEHIQGKLTTHDSRLTLEEVIGRVGEGHVHVSGHVDYSEAQSPAVDLSIRGTGIEFGKEVFSALPDEMAEQIEPFHPDGRFDITTKLTKQSASAELDHRSTVVLDNVTVTPDAFPVAIRSLNGEITFDQEGVRFKEVKGKYGEGKLAFSRYVENDGVRHAGALSIEFEQIQIDDALREAMPVQYQGILKDWQVEGPIDGKFNLQHPQSGKEESAMVDGRIRFDGVTLHGGHFGRPFEDVHANIVINDTTIEATEVTARFGDALLQADVKVRKENQSEEGVIVLRAGGVQLKQLLESLFPDSTWQPWRHLDLSGRADIYLDRLTFRRQQADQPRTWDVEGRLDVFDVDLPGVGDIQNAFGTIDVQGRLADVKGGMSLGGEIQLRNMDVLDRSLHAIKSSWSFVRSEAGEGRFLLDEIQGELYDGMLASQIELQFDDSSVKYDVSATVHDMNLHAFLDEARLAKNQVKKPVSVRGLLSGRLRLSGVFGEVFSRRGHGQIEILDGDMYQFPLVLAILNVINLSVPDGDAFDSAAADFVVSGNRVQLDSVSIEGDAATLVGFGAMSWPDKGLNLNLIVVSPHGWARVPGLSDFVEGASREFMELRVTGPMSQPTVRLVPLPGLAAEFKELFRKRKPIKMRSVQR